MPEPTSLDELNRRCAANSKIIGFGSATTTILPCPFCGAPEWMRFPVTAGFTNYAEQVKPHECKECGRSARLDIRSVNGGLETEIVQCGGPDQPEWMNPKMRREDAPEAK